MVLALSLPSPEGDSPCGDKYPPIADYVEAFSHLGLIQAAIALDMPEGLTQEALE